MEKMILNIFLIVLITINLTSSQEDIIFSKESGFYTNEFLLTLSTSSESLKIFYTTDGSDPTNSTTRQEYSNPIQIKDRTQEPNIYSNYEEDIDSPLSISTFYGYRKPPHLVDKAMVIRVVSKNGEKYGKIFSKTYFITDKELSQFERFTVISLVINPENLFDPDKGIYVSGNQYIEWKKTQDCEPETDFYCEIDIIIVKAQNGKEKLVFLFLKKEKLQLIKMLVLELRAFLQEIYLKKVLMFLREKNMEKKYSIVQLYYLIIKI